MGMTTLQLYTDYDRREVQGIFDPETTFTPQAGTWGLHGITRLRTIVSPFEIGVGDWARVDRGMSEYWDHRSEMGSVVEAPLELGERSRDVLPAHSTIGALEKGCGGL